MGIFQVKCFVQELTRAKAGVTFAKVMVDSGSEYTWLPEEKLQQADIEVAKRDIPFIMANGQEVTRHVGYAFLRSGEFETVDEVVFARPGDLRLLGARMLAGFAARVDPREKRLVAAGPLPAAKAKGR